MSKPKVLDLFCKAGGCSRGYAMAGFEPTGVDIEKQKRYPYEFIQADAMEILRDQDFLKKFAFIHASPPCQRYSVTKHLSNGKHPDLVGPVRELLLATGKPYVIENVVGAPLIYPVRLCGSSFGLDLRRHRLFESNLLLVGKSCRHKWQTPRFPPSSLRARRDQKLSRVIVVYGHGGNWHARRSDIVTVVGGVCSGGSTVAEWRTAMEIDWMTCDELAQAIPPAFTKFLGEQIMRIISSPTHSPFHRMEPSGCQEPITEPEQPLFT